MSLAKVRDPPSSEDMPVAWQAEVASVIGKEVARAVPKAARALVNGGGGFTGHHRTLLYVCLLMSTLAVAIGGSHHVLGNAEIESDQQKIEEEQKRQRVEQERQRMAIQALLDVFEGHTTYAEEMLEMLAIEIAPGKRLPQRPDRRGAVRSIEQSLK